MARRVRGVSSRPPPSLSSHDGPPTGLKASSVGAMAIAPQVASKRPISSSLKQRIYAAMNEAERADKSDLTVDLWEPIEDRFDKVLDRLESGENVEDDLMVVFAWVLKLEGKAEGLLKWARELREDVASTLPEFMPKVKRFFSLEDVPQVKEVGVQTDQNGVESEMEKVEGRGEKPTSPPPLSCSPTKGSKKKRVRISQEAVAIIEKGAKGERSPSPPLSDSAVADLSGSREVAEISALEKSGAVEDANIMSSTRENEEEVEGESLHPPPVPFGHPAKKQGKRRRKGEALGGEMILSPPPGGKSGGASSASNGEGPTYAQAVRGEGGKSISPPILRYGGLEVALTGTGGLVIEATGVGGVSVWGAPPVGGVCTCKEGRGEGALSPPSLSEERCRDMRGNMGVDLMNIRKSRCFRCLEAGHVAFWCEGPDRRGRCYSCSGPSHLAVRSAARTIRCPLCADLGRPDGHPLGAAGCTPLMRWWGRAPPKKKGGSPRPNIPGTLDSEENGPTSRSGDTTTSHSVRPVVRPVKGEGGVRGGLMSQTTSKFRRRPALGTTEDSSGASICGGQEVLEGMRGKFLYKKAPLPTK